jgi:hypothetical protein
LSPKLTSLFIAAIASQNAGQINQEPGIRTPVSTKKPRGHDVNRVSKEKERKSQTAFSKKTRHKKETAVYA